MEWVEIKTAIGAWSGLDRDALHIYFGLAAFLLAAAVLRRTVASPLPWLAVLLLQAANEAVDIKTADGDWIYGHSIHDMWNTMLVPTALLLAARYAPALFAAPDAAGPP